MSDDEAPKSAVELAMEKLRARDGFEEKTLSDEQKMEIAEIRSKSKARIAELEIHHQTKLAQIASHDEAQALQAELAKEKARVEESTEKKVQEVRSRSS